MISTQSKINLNSDAKSLNSMFAVSLLIATEIMFFTGLISAFLVAKTNSAIWPPLDQPRLPIERTAFNSILLLASGVTMYFAIQTFKRQNQKEQLIRWLSSTLVLGLSFVLLQGIEWTQLIRYGLTTTSSQYGAFFYLIVGAHALHAIIGILFLGIALYLKRTACFIKPTGLYWFFVVLLWPALYGIIYLQ